jgi:hypothetical protein
MSMRINSRLIGVLAGFVALSAFPAVAQNGTLTDTQPLSQALTSLATADGFEIRGLDRVGDETVQAPKSDSPVKALRRMLDGYAYTLELAPADAVGHGSGKLIRVSILGHSGDSTGDSAPSPSSSPVAPTPGAGADIQPMAADTGSSAGPMHPVSHMLQTIARTTLPQSANSGMPGAAGQMGVASSGTGTAGTGAPATGAAGSNPANMAELTRQASANLSALVQSLKASCPAGAKC